MIAVNCALSVSPSRIACHVPLALRYTRLSNSVDATRDASEAVSCDPAGIGGGAWPSGNGGIYGSLLSTPIVNPPQSGILGLHAIQERPVAIDGQVVVRPMMYIALTYDHRLVDGREAVTFLKRISPDR